MENRLADVHVALPGKVDTYDASQQKATIKPLLKRCVVTAEGEEVLEALPSIPDVPIVFPRAGDFFISLPIQPGDHVLLVFNERSIDLYTDSSGEDTNPVDLRKHHLSDAVAYPGFYPFSKSLTDADANDLVVGVNSGMQLHMRPGQAEFEDGTTQQSMVVAEALETFYGAVKAMFDSHAHPTGVGPSGPPAPLFPAYTPGTINSNKVKLPGN